MIGELLDAVVSIVVDGLGLIADLASGWSSAASVPSAGHAPPPGRVRRAVAAGRAAREAARGAHFEFDRHRLKDILFTRAELAGQRASALTTRRLRILATSWPERGVRRGIRRWLDLHRPGWRKRDASAP